MAMKPAKGGCRSLQDGRKRKPRPDRVATLPFPALRLIEAGFISTGATGSLQGDEKGSRVKCPRCPCNCKRRAFRPSRHCTDRVSRRRPGRIDPRARRAEERRVREECGSQGRIRWSPYHKKKKSKR